jgi:hypothetical protein
MKTRDIPFKDITKVYESIQHECPGNYSMKDAEEQPVGKDRPLDKQHRYGLTEPTSRMIKMQTPCPPADYPDHP